LEKSNDFYSTINKLGTIAPLGVSSICQRDFLWGCDCSNPLQQLCTLAFAVSKVNGGKGGLVSIYLVFICDDY
jgi:hypothetical protein